MSDTGDNSVWKVDLRTGGVSVLSSATAPDNSNIAGEIKAIKAHPELDYIIASDNKHDGLIAIDIASGARVFITKGTTSD